MVISPFFHKYIMANGDKTIEFVKTTSDKLDNVLSREGGRYQQSFIHIHDENSNGAVDDQLYIGEDRITDNFNIGNTSLNMSTIKVGGLEAATIGDLKEKSISEIIIDMVCPLTPPVRPSVTITYSGNTLIEVGSNLPTQSDISSQTDRGHWCDADNTEYAGSPGTITLTMNPNKWGEVSTEGKYKISGKTIFLQGRDSSDPRNNSKYSKWSQGNVTSNEITIIAVKPIYINGYIGNNDNKDISQMRKYLVNYIDGIELFVTIPSEVETPSIIKFKVSVPEQFGTFTVKQYNPLLDTYNIDVPMRFVSGASPYYERVDNTYTNTAPTKYKINLKK